jgi:O-antigen/teichoic acid export membrane protein
MSGPSITPPEPGVAGWVRGRLRYSPRLVPDTLWTLTNNFLTVASGLVIFKIISHWIAASDYGRASLVLGIVGLLNSLIAGPLVLAHMRLYFDHAKNGEGEQYFQTVKRLLLLTAAGMSAVYLLFSGASAILGESVYWTLALPAILLLFTQTQLSGTFAFLEVGKAYRALTIAVAASKILQVPALVALLYLSVSRPASIVFSQAVASAVVVFVWSLLPSFYVRTSTTKFSMAKISAAAMHVFGWSIYLFNLFSWLLTTSDRYIIEHFWSTKEVGIYALNYGLWSVPFLSMNAWLEQLVRARLYESAEADDRKKMMSLIRRRLMLTATLGTTMTAAIYFVGSQIAVMVIGERYWFGTQLMMLICVAHLFYVLAASLHVVFHAVKRTHALMWIAIVTSVANVAANLVLVPKMGIIGAGWSTLAAYVLMFVITILTAWFVLLRAGTRSDMDEVR